MPEKMLLLKLDHLGDLLWSIPFVRQLKQKLPQTEIYYCCRPALAEVPSRLPEIKQVLPYDCSLSLKEKLKFFSTLRQSGFSKVLVLGPTDKVNYLAFLSGAKERIGFFYRGNPIFGLQRLFFLTKHFPHPADLAQKQGKPVPHEVESMLELLLALGLEKSQTAAPEINFPLKPEERAFAQNWLKENRIEEGQELWAFHLSQKAVSWGWGAPEFAQLVKACQQEFPGKKWLLTWGPQEKEIFPQYCQQLKNIYPLGGLTLGQLGAMLEKVSLYLSWDTGVVHLALAVGSKVVDVFPPENYDYCLSRWGPWGERALAVKQPGKNLDKETINLIIKAADSLSRESLAHCVGAKRLTPVPEELPG